MTNLEKLELENQVLKNVIACVKEDLEEVENRELDVTIGRISYIVKFSDDMMKFALSMGYAIDYRVHKEKEPGDGNREGSGN